MQGLLLGTVRRSSWKDKNIILIKFSKQVERQNPWPQLNVPIIVYPLLHY